MRSSKYHDYRVFRIALFIILVVLGLFIYIKCIRAPLEHTAPANAWTVEKKATCTTDGSRYKVCTECGEKFNFETIPATGHTAASSPEMENQKAPTCTEGGSYDLVTYCKDCDIVLSEETVQVEANGHSPSNKPTKDNVINPTHATHGSYENVYRCTECDEVLKVEPQIIEPTGHSYSWTLEYVGNPAEYYLVGDCNCGEEGNRVVLTSADGLTVRPDPDVATCCLNRFIGTAIYNGERITATINHAPHDHKIYRIDALDKEDNTIISPLYVPISEFAKWDDKYGVYYDANLEGIRYYDSEDNQWDENGFANGVFQCVACIDKHCEVCSSGDCWYVVTIYSAAHDTRIEE